MTGELHTSIIGRAVLRPATSRRSADAGVAGVAAAATDSSTRGEFVRSIKWDCLGFSGILWDFLGAILSD